MQDAIGVPTVKPIQVMQRDVGIDVLKCLAVLCIYNAHSTVLYPCWKWLSTGGYIGDALFFFCSGFALLLKELPRFDTWYKRRLSRLWPSCFAWAVIVGVLGVRTITVVAAMDGEMGWFLLAILQFYVVIYLIGKYFASKIAWAFWLIEVLCLVALSVILYCGGNVYLWKRLFFFPVMLLGAHIGRRSLSGRESNSFIIDLGLLILSFLVFMGLITIGTRCSYRFYMFKYAQVLAQPFILLFVYFAYKTASSTYIRKLKSNTVVWMCIMFVGGLCLDFYLVKWACITDRLTWMFPVNLPIVLAYLLGIAYLNRAFGRLIAQTFQAGPYDWKTIWRLV